MFEHKDASIEARESFSVFPSLSSSHIIFILFEHAFILRGHSGRADFSRPHRVLIDAEKEKELAS